MRNSDVFALAVAVVLMCSSFDASAVSGVVRGRLKLWNVNGNYCPKSSTRPCTGNAYINVSPAGSSGDMYDAEQPVSNARVVVWNDTSGQLGVGTTDSSGWYVVPWSFSGSLPQPQQTYVFWYPTHKDSRFSIYTPNGSYPWWATSNFTPTNGTTTGSPQQLGTFVTGSSTAPDPYANAYWAAEFLWRKSYAYVSSLQANFMDLEIRGFADTMAGYMSAEGLCGSSCANGATNRVQLDASAAFTPQHRIMHEMGHIAVYKAQPFTEFHDSHGVYCYPFSAGTKCSWSMNSLEWGAAGFAESFATFLADSALYTPAAVTPTSCLSVVSCSTSSANIETSSGSSCGTNEARNPISMERFFWDVYDEGDDGGNDVVTEGSVAAFTQMVDVLGEYDPGTGFEDRDEPWNSAYTDLTQRDGRASSSWVNHYVDTYVVNLIDVWTLNCSPP